jgi:putative restriction endonuclease
MVNIYIANTDHDWFSCLVSDPNVAEVNFWKPSGSGFQAIQPGEIFAFRLKSPVNKIGGFGVLSSSSILPLQLAWEAFGRGNGVTSFEEMRASIARYRPNETVGPMTNIGCRILVEPLFFFPELLWFDLPASWSPNIVGGKTFSTDYPEGLALWDHLLEAASFSGSATPAGLAEPQARFGEPTLITPRLGQGAFRIAVTEAYQRRCAVTEGKVLPALDAAHIRPYADGGIHSKPNGILLRKDIHSVLDAGYATIDPSHRFVVSNKVREIFHNGEEYLRLHGKQLNLPKSKEDWPNPEFIEWHNERRFLG